MSGFHYSLIFVEFFVRFAFSIDKNMIHRINLMLYQQGMDGNHYFQNPLWPVFLFVQQQIVWLLNAGLASQQRNY